MTLKDEILKKIKNYNPNDIVFLKKEWRKWAEKQNWDIFEMKTGVNVQAIYSIFDEDKIIEVNKAKYEEDRYEIILKHSRQFVVRVIIKFDTPNKNDLGIVTFFKCLNQKKF